MKTMISIIIILLLAGPLYAKKRSIRTKIRPYPTWSMCLVEDTGVAHNDKIQTEVVS